jgi:hypothetical protein
MIERVWDQRLDAQSAPQSVAVFACDPVSNMDCK